MQHVVGGGEVGLSETVYGIGMVGVQSADGLGVIV